MQRLALLVIGLAPAALGAQRSAGSALWRVAAQTLPVPPALIADGAAAFWNPAQAPAPRVVLALEAVQGANDVGADGMMAEGRIRAGRVGSFALLYGRMELRDLVRTSSSPTPDPGGIPYYTQLVGGNWARRLGLGTVGVTVAAHTTTLDQANTRRTTLDAGVTLPLGRRVRVAAASHFADHLATDDPAQDLYAGLEVVAWRSRPAPGTASLEIRVRYGTALAHGFSADHQFGCGVAVGALLAADFLAARDGGWAGGGWRPVVGVRLGVGKYRVAVAGDGGASGLGTTFRVAFETRLP